MKGKPADIARAIDAGGDTIRLYLLHGQDQAGSNALAARLGKRLGPDAERIALGVGTLKSDPALLADEAAAFSLFGGKRWILVEGGGDELLGAVGGLLDAPAAGNPVAIVVASALKKTSKLLALIETSPRAMACASYVPEGRDAERLVIDLGRAAGLAIAPDVARRIADAGGGDRALIGFELDKFALYLDAAPEHPATLEHAVLDDLSAGNDEGDLSRIVDAVLDGRADVLDRELRQLAAGSGDGMLALRALARRILLLARMRGDVERGGSVDAVMGSAGKSLFFKDKAAVGRQLGRWNAARLATALHRVLDAERQLKAPASLGIDAVNETLFTVARAAKRAG